MLFALICTDKPNSLDVRMANRPAHLTHLNSLGDRLKAAGPFLNDAGEMSGSLVIIEAADRAAAEEMAHADPFAKAGLFASIEVRAWRWAIKNPEAQ